MVAVDHGENLDPAHIAPLELAHGRANIWKNAALAGRDDHQFEIFGAILVDSAGERARQIHFRSAGADHGIGFVDGTIRNTRKLEQDLDLLAGLDLARPREQGLRWFKASRRQQLSQLGKIRGGQVIELDPDAAGGKTMALEQVSEHPHAVKRELVPYRDVDAGLFGANGGCFHIDDEKRYFRIGRHQRHGVSPTHQ